MPKFTKLDPNDVQIGRGRGAHEARQACRDALDGSAAGRIELDCADVASTVKRHLSLAARDVGTKVQSSWEHRRQRVLLWKKVGSQVTAARPRPGVGVGVTREPSNA